MKRNSGLKFNVGDYLFVREAPPPLWKPYPEKRLCECIVQVRYLEKCYSNGHPGYVTNTLWSRYMPCTGLFDCIPVARKLSKKQLEFIQLFIRNGPVT